MIHTVKHTSAICRWRHKSDIFFNWRKSATQQVLSVSAQKLKKIKQRVERRRMTSHEWAAEYQYETSVSSSHVPVSDGGAKKGYPFSRPSLHLVHVR